MKLSVRSIILAGILYFGFHAQGSVSTQTATDDSKKVVEFDGVLRLDNDFNPDENGALQENLRFQKFEVGAKFHVTQNLPFNLAKEMLLVVRTRMEQDVVVNGILKANHLTAADYLKEAYLQFNEVGGLPVAVVIGTMEVSYGQDYDGTLSLQNDINHPMSDPDQGQVKGFTITLDKNIKNLFDTIEASMFTSQGDLTRGGFGQMDGFAFRVTRDFNEFLSTEISVLHKENAYDPELKPETKLSFGALFQKGRWAVWSEAFSMKNSEAYPDDSFGVTAGTSRITGPGRITFNATTTNRTLQQYAVGYDLYLTKNWTIGPTVRYTHCADGNAGCVGVRGYGQGPSIGISARYAFGEGRENPVWLSKKALSRIRTAISERLKSKY